ncbi:hypothetical protein [Novipirellula rosea]|uniref:Uncharacterized protein n=1 Tax=Novipirellula rosea TaxID=1031540 RepID=A0ABP8NME8_9BACT
MTQEDSTTDHDHSSMANRGVTRQAMNMESDGGMMSDQDRGDMQTEHHAQTAWVWWTLILLGVWTMVAPYSFGYASNPISPAAVHCLGGY